MAAMYAGEWTEARRAGSTTICFDPLHAESCRRRAPLGGFEASWTLRVPGSGVVPDERRMREIQDFHPATLPLMVSRR
jgi:hypothetical protein